MADDETSEQVTERQKDDLRAQVFDALMALALRAYEAATSSGAAHLTLEESVSIGAVPWDLTVVTHDHYKAVTGKAHPRIREGDDVQRYGPYLLFPTDSGAVTFDVPYRWLVAAARASAPDGFTDAAAPPREEGIRP